MKMRSVKISYIFILIPLLFISTINNLSFAEEKVSVGGTPSASSDNSSNNPASYAFDSSASTYWFSDSIYYDPTPWLRYKLSSAKVVQKYRIQSYPWASCYPISWYFQGSNNGSTWITLDTRSGYTYWAGNTWREFTFYNETSYLYYRIYITSVGPLCYVYYGETYCNYYAAISEFELYNMDCVITGTLTSGKYTCPARLSTQNTTTVNSGTNVSISAGYSVTLKPGFTAAYGSICNISIDTDQDGISDSWEYYYFGNLSSATATSDYDGDAATDFWEYLLGTNPKVASIDNDSDGIPDWYEIQENGNLDQDQDDGYNGCGCE